MDRFGGRNVAALGEVVANDAVWRGKAEVVAGEEGAPGDVRVDGMKDLVDRVLLHRVEDGLLV